MPAERGAELESPEAFSTEPTIENTAPPQAENRASTGSPKKPRPPATANINLASGTRNRSQTRRSRAPANTATALREIGDVASELGIPQHVLRYWEDKFAALRPRRVGGGRRRYSPKDVALLWGIKRLLHDRYLTIDGAQKVLREEGIDAVRYPGPAPMEPGIRKQLVQLRETLRALRADLSDD